MIDLQPQHLEMIKKILADFVPEAEVRVFGSRITGKAKPFSDLDLAIFGDEKLDWKTIADMKVAFEESDLPFRVDVLDWHTIDDNFRKIIAEKFEVIKVNPHQPHQPV